MRPRTPPGHPRLPGGARRRRAVRGMRGGRQAPPPRSAGAEAAGTSKPRHKPSLPAASRRPPHSRRPGGPAAAGGPGWPKARGLAPCARIPCSDRRQLAKVSLPGAGGGGEAEAVSSSGAGGGAMTPSRGQARAPAALPPPRGPGRAPQRLTAARAGGTGSGMQPPAPASGPRPPAPFCCVAAAMIQPAACVGPAAPTQDARNGAPRSSPPPPPPAAPHSRRAPWCARAR